MYKPHYFFKLLAIFAVVLLMAGCQEELYSNLHEQEANEMLAVLMKHDITASKVRGKKDAINLFVEKSEMPKAVDVLKQNGYPSQSFQDMGDIFKKEGLISSPLEERARYIYAISQDISLTLSKLDGVLSARVHVVLPESDKLGKVLRPSSAAVFIKHRKDVDVESSIPKIKLLVNNSIEGLDYDKITVALFPSVPLADTVDASHDKPLRSGFNFSGKIMFLVLMLFFVLLLVAVYLYYEWQKSSKSLKKMQRSSRSTMKS
jgi:type III secretion protein J